jgi:predicted AAA+ superfamily ATPase
LKDLIIETYYRLLQAVPTKKHRYLFNTFSIESRLIGIIGARGTGKTTLMLQYIKERLPNHDEALYFSADHLYFANHSLLEFVQEQFEKEGRSFFFIDEIHKYPNWNQELKNIYDSFPAIHLVFSGSSNIKLIQGSYDLSRRAILFRLQGLSFREYVNFECDKNLSVVPFENVLDSHRAVTTDLSQIPKLLRHFQNYCKEGFYPFYFEERATFSARLLSVIEKTIYNDIASFYSLKTDSLPVLKKLVVYFSTIQPGETSINNIANSLMIDNKTVARYIEILCATGILRSVGIDKTGSAMIRNPEKVFLNNPNMYHSILSEIGHSGRIGTIRECFFLTMLQGAGKKVFYSKQGDYTVDSHIFEIGGKGKDFSQIKESPDGFLVKDDLLISSGKREIPLYLFGFLY